MKGYKGYFFVINSIIKCLNNGVIRWESTIDQRLTPLTAFKVQLQAGLNVAREIKHISSNSNLSHATDANIVAIIASAKLVQNLALQSIVDNDGIIIPTEWIGHATTMVIKPGSKVEFYNLAFINSGQGLQHHYTGPDPDNIYPYLSRLWIEFKDIPQERIFNSETAWLFYALAAIKNSKFAGRIKTSLGDDGESLPSYFYGSLLGNFKDYLVVPQGDEINDRLVPEQQSGSCAMSSLMGALLYYSDSLKTFHCYRLKIGHEFLGTFLDRLGPIVEGRSLDEDDLKFLSILKDGFFSGGSNHFYGLIRALANHHLQYLEQEFPEEFKHAGLIGSGRSTWIRDRKVSAIGILSLKESAKFDLQRTIELAKSVHEIALKFQFRPETTHIRDLSEVHEAFRSSGEIYMEHSEEATESEIVKRLQFTAADGGNIYQNLLSGKPELLERETTIPINTFEDFYNVFLGLFRLEDFRKESYFMRFLDIFKGLRAGGGGWELIHDHGDHTDKERLKLQLLELQQSCKLVAFGFAQLSNSYGLDHMRKANMDEITLLGHLQLLSWNLFKALHKLEFSSHENEINWDKIAPPQTIQSLLSNFYKMNVRNFHPNSRSNGNVPIKGFNVIENHELYRRFLRDSQPGSIVLTEQSEMKAFPGPESYGVYTRTSISLTEPVFRKLMENDGYREIMVSFMSLPEVDGILDNLIREDASWSSSEIKNDYAKYLIVMFRGQDQLFNKIRHFYDFMYTLISLIKGVKSEGVHIPDNAKLDEEKGFWAISRNDPRTPKGYLTLTQDSRDCNFQMTFTGYDQNPEQTKFRVLNAGIIPSSTVFSYFLLSSALPEEIGLTDVDIWFNYIKNAKSSKIFDISTFQYLTDQLLNMPANATEPISLFDEKKAHKIVLELIKLIRNTFKELNDDSKIMTTLRRETIVRRAANISVITTRFISRMNYEFKDSVDPVDWASLLAKIYNTLEPYSYFNSPIWKLSDSDVSILNFSLSHMCYAYLNDPEKFIQSVKLGFEYPNQRNRKTLARFHWFVAKMNYRPSLVNMVSDDQFKYGFLGSPLGRLEFRFFESLVKEKFLRPYLRTDSADYAFKYESEGYVVEIIASLQDSPQTRLLINLATGAIVENGHMLANKSPFISSFEFQNYFPPQSHRVLSFKGKAFMFSGIPVFLLPTFKGSIYFMIQYLDQILLLRKWHDNWYIWGRPEEDYKNYFEALRYKWAGHTIKTFKKYRSDIRYVQVIIFDEYAVDPIVKITKNHLDTVASYQLSIPSLTDGVSGKIISPGDYLELHLNAFAEEGITVARQESDGTLIVVYNKHRLSDDLARPFVLTSSPSDNVIHVQNIKGMEICKDQRIMKDGSGLPGSLVATFGGKKILLLPFTEALNQTKKPVHRKSYVTIEKLPTVEVRSNNPAGDNFAVPTPQSRMHKLLLAYYMILAQRYDSARQLLHPSTSIRHNEAFDAKELQIIKWIMNIYMAAPEFNALTLVIYSHFLLNEAKFTFEYDQESLDLVKEMKGIKSVQIFKRHTMSIRELPEKYYIFKIFPEILTWSSTLSRAFLEFGFQGSVMPENPSEDIEFPVLFSLGQRQQTFDFVSKWTLQSLFYLMNDDLMSMSQPEAEMIRLKNILSKHLLVRNNSRQKFDKRFEMAVYCYILNPNIWTEFKTLLVSDSRNFLLKRDDLIISFNSSIKQCNYQSQFEGITLAHLSKYTDPLLIRETMINDLGMAQDYEITNHTITIGTSNERTKMLELREILMARIRSSGSDNSSEDGVSFDIKLDDSSRPVLTSLSNSISSYISEKGANHLERESLDLRNEEPVELRTLNQTLIDRITELKARQNTLTKSLTFMTSATSNSIAHSLERLFSCMHLRKEKTFSDLYACYLRNSPSCIQKKFPQLNPEQCIDVHSKAVLFFSQQILLDYLKMVQESAQGFLISDSVPVDDLLIFCDELAKISDFNARILNPVIMNFEFRSKKYRLKREQVADIALLTEKEGGPDDNFKSVVIQRMMAAGKTLVLGTISVVRKALEGRGKLSILVPPSSLYQSNTSAMQNRTYQYFKKKGNNFSFPRLPLARDEDFGRRVSAYLENVIQIINQTIKSRNYLILSPDHLQSFMNSYIEAIENAENLCTGDNYVRYSKILQQFATIYQIFRKQSSIILDEIDMTMDPKKELNFPTDETETYNMTAVEMLADIIEFMLFDKNIKEAGLNIHSNNQAALTTENYIKCRDIVLNYIETQLGIETSVWHKFVPESAAVGVMAFLRAENMSYDIDSLSAMEQNKEFAKALIIVKTQLHMHLQELLGGTVNQNYGSAGLLRPQIKYAVPYVAANTPSAGSIFADRWETLIKTILMVSASPCSFETAKDIIKYSRKAIMAESAGKSGMDIPTLPTFQNMKMILPVGFEILELDENESIHVANVHKGLINRSPAAIRIIYGYFINEVLSKMEFPVDQITSNALNMTSMFASVQGYSGTIDNVNILPQRVVSAAAIDHEDNEKNNGGIALKLIEDADDAEVLELDEKSLALSADEMMSRFLDLLKQEPIDQVSAIIDTGAFFKNFKNRQVAEAILCYFKGRIETVLYYDETSNQLEFIRGTFHSENISFTVGFLDTTDPDDISRATQTRIEERFTFYDQRHITGSDILQPKGAHAIMSAGPRVLLRDILQGTMRMRQFMTSQKVHLVVTESVRKFYRSKIDKKEVEEPKDVEVGAEEEVKLEEQGHEHLERLRVSDLLTLGALNENEKQKYENEKLAFGKIDAEIRAFVLDEISENLTSGRTDIEKIKNRYISNRDLFVRSIKEDPFSWLVDRELQNTVELLEKHVANRLLNLSPLVSSSEEQSRYENFTEQLGLMYKIEYKTETNSLLKYLSETILVRAANSIGAEILMQNQTQTLNLIELHVLDVNRLVKQIDVPYEPRLYEFDLLKARPCLLKEEGSVFSEVNDFYSLKTIYEDQFDSKQDLVTTILLTDGNDIGVTADLVQLYDDTTARFPIFSKYNLEGSHFLVFTLLENLDRPKVILLSPRHAAQVFKSLQQGDQGWNYNFWLCDLAGDVIITKNNLESPAENIFNLEEFKTKLELLIFDLLIFNGSFTQILANSKLRKLYENDWMSINDFQSRAVFLRLRMKVLQEKDSHILEEDDSDYVKLKRYSSGDFVTETEVIRADGYAKGAIDSKIQSIFLQEHPAISDETLGESTSKLASDTLKEYYLEIFGESNNNPDDSCLELKDIFLESEDEIFESSVSVNLDDEVSFHSDDEHSDHSKDREQNELPDDLEI